MTYLFQYYYAVRVLPGQEPFNVWIGWVTSDFHQHDTTFDADNVGTVTVTLGDDTGKVQERLISAKRIAYFCEYIRVDGLLFLVKL